MIELKTPEQIDIMHESNIVVHEILFFARENAKAGMTTEELDVLMGQKLQTYPGATPAFLGYHGYPKVACISVNSVVVHGIPDKYVLQDGDVVSIDFGVYLNGFAGDSAITFVIGESKNEAHEKLIRETQRGLFTGVEQMLVGNRLYDINKAINQIAIDNKYGNVKHYCGHGIGRAMHEKPSVFNYIEHREPNIRLQEGLVLALEPMFTLGSADTDVMPDKWTVVTSDASVAVHWELSIAITENGPRILGHGFDKIYED